MTNKEAIEDLEFMVENDDFGTLHVEAIEMAISALQAEPCEDAISRQAIIDLVVANHTEVSWTNVIMYSPFYKGLIQLPPVQPKAKTGHWIRMKAFEKWGCSECNTVFRFTFKEHDYCPNCGCRMIEPRESEE